MSLNSRNSETAARPGWPRTLLVMGCCFAMALASCVQAVHSGSGLSASPENGGDQDSYERLGYNLAAGLGFGYCPGDTAILQGLAEPQPVEACTAGCRSDEFMPTAYRPPGFPLLIAAVYRISPLNYSAVRILNCVCCAAAIALAAAAVARRISPSAGLLGGILCSLDPRLREFAGSFLTENPATLSLTVFVLLFTRFLERRSIGSAAAAGLSFSILVLMRSFYVAWYPLLCLVTLVSLVGLIRPNECSHRVRQATILTAVFVVAGVSVTGPWWIRNCMVLEAFMPTGTQGGIGIADGFSDSAVANHGSWTSATADSIARELRLETRDASLTPIQFEREHARRGAAAARAWIRSHPELLPSLSWSKFGRLWEFGSRAHTVLFLVMLLGFVVRRRDGLVRVLFLLLVLNSLTVVATYHTYERFLLPFRPLMHGMIACGLLSTVHTALDVIRRKPGISSN